jgi:hypothetical protein
MFDIENALPYKPNSRRRGSLQKAISGIDNALETDYMYRPFLTKTQNSFSSDMSGAKIGY